MSTLHSFLVSSHIGAGALALILFWVPAIARKGSAVHVRSGQVYVVAMYVVSITAFAASTMVLADPLGIRRPGEVLDAETATRFANIYRMNSLFLLMLSVLVMSSLRHGVLALRARRTPGALGDIRHRFIILFQYRT